MTNRYKPLLTLAAFAGLAALLWILRSWNLEIGDGEFCCKQTSGEKAFAVTMSRSLLSYSLYRFLFFWLNPFLDWWVEDIIALSSCAAGLVYFFALNRLAASTMKDRTAYWLMILFPSTTLLLQIFCGHVEFYPWTCAMLMVCLWLSWETIHGECSILWPSIVLALAGAFHSSGIFYFPTLLLLPVLSQNSENKPSAFSSRNLYNAGLIFFIFIMAALLHRKPTHWIYITFLVVGYLLYTYKIPQRWKTGLSQWWKLIIPWLALFAVRAVLGLRAEPLFEHLPPLREPYDHGAYLYMAFSWDHLYDKVMFHLWLTPLGLIALLGFFGVYHRRIIADRWLLYICNCCLWAMVWSILFYPQLRTRDWDLFATISIPLNLFALYAAAYFWKAKYFKIIAAVGIVVHLVISTPIILRNSNILSGRGYVTVKYEPKPVSTTAYIRGLKLGVTPLEKKNIRSGKANARMIPLERGYKSWAVDMLLEPGKTYLFNDQLEAADNLLTQPRAEDF